MEGDGDPEASIRDPGVVGSECHSSIQTGMMVTAWQKQLLRQLLKTNN